MKGTIFQVLPFVTFWWAPNGGHVFTPEQVTYKIPKFGSRTEEAGWGATKTPKNGWHEPWVLPGTGSGSILKFRFMGEIITTYNWGRMKHPLMIQQLSPNITKRWAPISYKYLEPETSTLKWLFQLDDSKSVHRKWLFHQTSIKNWLFRVPGSDYNSTYFWVSCPSYKFRRTCIGVIHNSIYN